jgi:leucine-rich repeat transmembrane neuronal protein 1/2
VYEWNPTGGTITYYYPEEKRPDTKDDLLSLGFITDRIDAVLVRIDSQGGDMHSDYLQLEIVSIHLDQDNFGIEIYHGN